MGKLLWFVRNQAPLDEADVQVLTACLRDRNFLAHEFWYRRSSLLFTRSGCEELIAELEVMSDGFKRGNVVAEAISRSVRSRAGVSETLIQDVQRAYLARLQQGEPEETALDLVRREFGLSP